MLKTGVLRRERFRIRVYLYPVIKLVMLLQILNEFSYLGFHIALPWDKIINLLPHHRDFYEIFILAEEV
jgi:hypothetical protein